MLPRAATRGARTFFSKGRAAPLAFAIGTTTFMPQTPLPQIPTKIILQVVSRKNVSTHGHS